MRGIRRSGLVWIRLNSLAAAIIAVFAALGTLFAHHRSVSALAAMNQAVLEQTRSFDAYNAYDGKEIRYTVYQALVASGLVRDGAARARLESIAKSEKTSLPEALAKSEAFQQEATHAEESGEKLMRSYETLQLATTFFEVAIVFVSIATLAEARFFLPAGCALGGIGLVLFLAGLLQGR